MGGEAPRGAPSNYPPFAEKPVGQKISGIYKDRLRQFTATGQYQGHNLVAKYFEATNDDEQHVKLSVYSVPNLERPAFKHVVSKEFKPTKRGEVFGPSWSTHWFKIRLTIPEDMRKKERLEFHWDANNEGMVWSEDGNPLQGLTGGGERVEWIIPDGFRDGKEHVFYIEMACNGMFGNANGDIIQPPNPNRYFRLNTARITAINLEARALYYDFWMIGDAAREFPGDSWQSHEALRIGNAMMDAFIDGNGSQEAIKAARKIAEEYIGTRVNSPDVYKTEGKSLVFGIGHCHIDSCWLWPFAETKRKVARSWSTQCDLMERYPEFRFCCSQAQQFKWLEEGYPYAFDRVKGWVKKGHFQPIGGSWVEHDTNLPSGESLVRQFLYGQRYFESRFGQRCSTFWLPDTFGYSSQLPQLCRLAGMSRFFTQKLSWNNINNFPHTTFNWVSPDGSQVLCHMTPAETYTASAHFGDVKRSISQHKSMDQDNTSLLVFGKGDGGGGPTFEHIEKLRRLRGLSDQVGLLPRVTMGGSVDDFYSQLEAKAASGTEFANNKRNNRQAEFVLRDLELLATLATLKDSDYKYPKKALDDMWESVLLCEFHNCLLGSSIEMCYDDSDKIYAEVFATAKNPQSRSFEDSRFLARKEFRAEAYSSQFITLESIGNFRGGTGVVSAEPLSTSQKTSLSVTEIEEGVFQLKSDALSLRVSNGVITSLVDVKADREIIPRGKKANQFVIFDDKPLYWQAWDVEVYHLDSRKELQSGTTKIAEKGPHRVSVVTETKISDASWIKTTISLTSESGDVPAYVEMNCEVEWRENMKFLKVEFPVDITNTEASYETQYAVTRRPTHYNTSWDMAKFEVCCHKWADLSESDYGVSILNDSKYGFATCGNLMRLSLLRAPKAPDANADIGRHHIRYAIMPHTGPLDYRTVRAGYNFNNPLVLQAQSGIEADDLFKAIKLTGAPNLILDTIKRGEDDEDVSRGELEQRSSRSIILRIYDSMGGKSRGTIEVRLPIRKVYKCNLLEDDLESLKVEEGKNVSKIDIELRPFEVATYRLQL
ncbi:hypothetical protein UREG_07684 [Uncinocarpus reesii 1704]|uniref:Alpha-mannosidase n=1 Tax=Uncinocarpus reesii (strain UAMH 1704) TaxID=336963 RepID=C4JZT3_UNCRE|nr:uncharacterized protein UREG_07684 [Uncinocarpus reesii 1704]EEP82819.1 hypothetical protein UREG_07684 [Uncinocarpus reesii 1704]